MKRYTHFSMRLVVLLASTVFCASTHAQSSSPPASRRVSPNVVAYRGHCPAGDGDFWYNNVTDECFVGNVFSIPTLVNVDEGVPNPITYSQTAATCYNRYDAVYSSAITAALHAPQPEHKALRNLVDAIEGIQARMRAENDFADTTGVCGALLTQAEAKVAIWRANGWLPTYEEQRAAADAAAVKALQDALKN